METNEERRRRKLVALVSHHGLSKVASHAQLSDQYLDQIIKRVKLPAKADGTRSERCLADAAARKIESALNLPIGWMDWPFDGFDPVTYYSMTEKERGELEGIMRDEAVKIISRRGKHLAA